MNPRVSFETLGCKLNQYETDALAAGFRDLGWILVEAGQSAEAVVINTCTVTNRADKKSRHAVKSQINSLKAPIVVVTGCFAESARESLEGQHGITFVIPNGRKNQIPSLVDSYWRGSVPDTNLPEPDPFGFSVHSKTFHTRASLKIQDGCDNFCSFCIIPSVRGPAVSRSFTETVEAAQQMLDSGRKEIVLTGVNMGKWQYAEKNFTGLVEALLALDGDFRLRITSLEPEGMGETFASLFDHPKMAPHLHLCLQSGSDRLLQSMRRNYNLNQYASLIRVLRSKNPRLNLTTDLIVGYPGETEEDFRCTMKAVEAFEFGYVHVFPYSQRQGTLASAMTSQVPEVVKNQRSRMLQELVRSQRIRAMEKLVGSQRRVLVETSNEELEHNHWRKGLTEDYFPVRFLGTTAWNEFAAVRLERVVHEGAVSSFEAVSSDI